MHNLLTRYENLSKPAKASLWFITCYFIQRGLQFISMPVYTRIMSPTEYGVYSVFLSWFNLISVFTSLNIYSGTFNKAMVKYEEQRDQYISSIQWLTLLVSLVISIVILSLSSFIFEKTGYSLNFQLLLCLHLITFPSLQYWSQKQRFLFEYKRLVAITLINSIASLILGIGFVLISTDKAFALVVVTVFVQLVINGLLFFSLSLKGKTFYNEEFWKWSVVMAVPLIPHSLSEILLNHANRLMINQMCGASQAGIYNVVYQISMVMTILRQGINGSFTPWLYYSLKGKKYSNIRRVTNMITLMTATLTLLFMLIGPEILQIAAPPAYYEAVAGIPAIMIGCFFIYVYVLFVNVEIYFEQNQFVAVASVTAAIVNVTLNYFCINAYGYLSAPYTTMISYLLMAVMHYSFMRHIAKKNASIYEIYDIRFLFIASCLLIVAGFIMLNLYQLILLRWLLILILVLLIIVKREKIKIMLKMLKNRE